MVVKYGINCELFLIFQLLNQQNQSHAQATRIITPQGTIVTQNLPTQMAQHTVVQTNQNNGPLPQQNALTTIPQRSSPHPQQVQQVKKVVVQPNNASDMDDLEESITAAILTKHSVNENMNQSPQQFHAAPPVMRPNHVAGNVAQPHQQINFNSQHQFPQQIYDQHSQHPQTLTQLLMEPDMEEERQVLTLTNGQRITLADYKRMQQPPRANIQQIRYVLIIHIISAVMLRKIW